MARPHLFRLDNDRLIPTDHTRGPWAGGGLHGGAICGAVGWASAGAVDDGSLRDVSRPPFMLTRLTTEILRPVPVEPLTVNAEVVRRGRRVLVTAARLVDAGGRPLVRASAQWVRADPYGLLLTDQAPPPARPAEVTDPAAGGLDYPRPGFNCDALELRALSGTTEEPGPGVIWVRMKVDLIQGHPNGPIELLSAVSDYGNAVGWEPSADGQPMINPDVTLQVFRYPRSEWICLQSTAHITATGVGMMETVLWDDDGPVGRSLSTMLENTGADLSGFNSGHRAEVQ